MKKETFVKIIQALREQYKKEEKLSDLYYELFTEYPTTTTDNLVSNIVDALEDEFETEEIGWWLWDLPNGIKEDVEKDILWTKDGNPIDIKTPEKLYDYLTKK